MKNDRRQNSVQPTNGALREIASNFWYWLLGIAVFISTLAFAIWLPNLSFLRHTAVSSDYTTAQKFSLFFTSLGALDTNFSPLSRTLTIVVALLFAINVVLIVFYFRERASLQKTAGLGFAGTLTGLLGIGCAACGSVLLSSIFGIAATTSFIGFLPLEGQEFGVASVVILGFSIFITAKKINEPSVCKISKSID